MRRQSILLAGILLLFWHADLRATTGERCSLPPQVIVLAADSAALREICSAADQAITFLAKFALSPQRDIVLEITNQQIDSHGYSAFGSYDSRRDRIQLMSYAAIMASNPAPTMYGEPFDRVHYAGAIAHETAHAVVQHNLAVKLIGTSAQEYLAHATQLAVLPAQRRQAIIAGLGVGAWESGDLISDAYMAMEPGKFAVKSYLHLLSLKNPQPFIHILLNSKWFYVSVP